MYATCRKYPESHVALVLIGSNDLKNPHISFKVFEETIRQIMWASKNTGKRTIFGTLPPIDPKMMPCFPKDVMDNLRTCNKIIRDMPCEIVEFYDMIDYLVDGIHLTPDGYRVMAERWNDAI